MSRRKVRINLALQGGGSHGGFTWGVLDRLLEEPWIDIEGGSAASAGLMNMVALADGWARGGRSGARDKLDELWERVGEAGRYGPVRRSFIDIMLGNWNLDESPGAAFAEIAHTVASPYQMNPGNWSPLRDILGETINISRVLASPVKVFGCATNVQTGRIRVFTNADDATRRALGDGCGRISVDSVLASACLPFLFPAVEIDGVPYWDGGFVGNPAIWPLIYGCESRDVAIVQINPLVRGGTPRTPAAIANRVKEISFNNALMSEMRAIAFVDELIETDKLAGQATDRYKQMLVHRIHAEDAMLRLGTASKMNAEPCFLRYLRQLGRETAGAWLQAHAEHLGTRSTLDIRQTYL
jgi:NTE family protein